MIFANPSKPTFTSLVRYLSRWNTHKISLASDARHSTRRWRLLLLKGETMAQEKPLDAQEQRYLNALKLFMDRGEDPKHKEAAKWLDEMTPEEQRCLIQSYHLALEDPDAFVLSHKLINWLSPYFRLKNAIKRIFQRNRVAAIKDQPDGKFSNDSFGKTIYQREIRPMLLEKEMKVWSRILFFLVVILPPILVFLLVMEWLRPLQP
jgi:hypothetical protein